MNRTNSGHLNTTYSPVCTQRISPKSEPWADKKKDTLRVILRIGEGLYCKRPIQCLASSEILTPHPLTAGASVYPPPLVGGGGHTRRLERARGGGGSIVLKTPVTALYSIYVSILC
jgi:hypothetical protein